MIIKKDFDKFKKAVSNPEDAERLIAYNGPSLELFEYKKVNITNLEKDEITGTYTHGRYHYVIKFLRTKNNTIDYSINTSISGYTILGALILAVIVKHGGVLAFALIIFLIIYLVNNQIKVGIYNRINAGWQEIVENNTESNQKTLVTNTDEENMA